MSDSFIWPIDRTLSGATTLGQSGPGSDDSEMVLYISLSFSITGALPSDWLMSYPEHLFWGGLIHLQICKWWIFQPQLTELAYFVWLSIFALSVFLSVYLYLYIRLNLFISITLSLLMRHRIGRLHPLPKDKISQKGILSMLLYCSHWLNSGF